MNSNTLNQDMGFSWGFTSTSLAHKQETKLPSNVTTINRDSNEQRPKRRMEDDNGNSNSSNNENNEDNIEALRNSHLITRPLSNMNYSNTSKKHIVRKRKSNLSQIIQGQALPIQRGIELMEKEQLQDMVLELIKSNPQISQHVHQTIVNEDFKIEKCINILKLKLSQLYENIPYNKAFLNDNSVKLDDYAFVRMKPHILEFLNCLVDFILDNIPPRKRDLHESLKFLDTCTEMTINLPRFQLPSNNYYYDKCLEQLSCIWCTLIEHIVRDIMMTMNDRTILLDCMNRLMYFNERSNGLLGRPIQLFKSLDLTNNNEILQSNNTSTSNTASEIFRHTNHL